MKPGYYVELKIKDEISEDLAHTARGYGLGIKLEIGSWIQGELVRILKDRIGGFQPNITRDGAVHVPRSVRNMHSTDLETLRPIIHEVLMGNRGLEYEIKTVK